MRLRGPPSVTVQSLTIVQPQFKRYGGSRRPDWIMPPAPSETAVAAEPACTGATANTVRRRSRLDPTAQPRHSQMRRPFGVASARWGAPIRPAGEGSTGHANAWPGVAGVDRPRPMYQLTAQRRVANCMQHRVHAGGGGVEVWRRPSRSLKRKVAKVRLNWRPAQRVRVMGGSRHGPSPAADARAQAQRRRKG